MSRPYRTDKPLDCVEVPLSTVRGLYVLLGQLMERYADTNVYIGSLEEGVSLPNALSLWDTSADKDQAEFHEKSPSLILHTGPWPASYCQSPGMLPIIA